MDNHEHNTQYYMEHKEEVTIPEWDPKPIPVMPPSPKKSAPLRAGAGIERAAMSLKAKREEREQKDG